MRAKTAWMWTAPMMHRDAGDDDDDDEDGLASEGGSGIGGEASTATAVARQSKTEIQTQTNSAVQNFFLRTQKGKNLHFDGIEIILATIFYFANAAIIVSLTVI